MYLGGEVFADEICEGCLQMGCRRVFLGGICGGIPEWDTEECLQIGRGEVDGT